MPGWSSDDRLRSLRDWAVLVLGAPPWRVRTQRQDMPKSERPAVVVEASSAPLPSRARVSIPQGNVEWVQAFTLMAYPVPGETPAASRMEAERVADLLTRALVHGLTYEVEEGDPPAMVERHTAPLRLPLFDYAGVPVEGPDRAGPTEPYDWMWVAEPGGARPVQDPLDHLLWSVPLDLRLSWESPGRVVPAAPPVGDFGGTFEPPPQQP